MPSSITHQILAEEASQFFPPEIKRAADDHGDYLFLGAQGPDLFFFLKPLSKKQFNLGRYLHRENVCKVFSFLHGYLRLTNGEERERLTAYCAGYICHYAGDTAFHPFVYNYLKSNKPEGMIHQLIENDWDVYFARGRRGTNTAGWAYPFSAERIIREGTIAKMGAELSSFLGREPESERAFAVCVKNFARFLKAFHKKSHYKGLARMEKILHVKPKLSCLYPRENPDPAFLGGENFSELAEGKAVSADGLFLYAVRESVRLCKLFFAGDITRKDFNKSFLSGKDVSPLEK